MLEGRSSQSMTGDQARSRREGLLNRARKCALPIFSYLSGSVVKIVRYTVANNVIARKIPRNKNPIGQVIPSKAWLPARERMPTIKGDAIRLFLGLDTIFPSVWFNDPHISFDPLFFSRFISGSVSVKGIYSFVQIAPNNGSILLR